MRTLTLNSAAPHDIMLAGWRLESPQTPVADGAMTLVASRGPFVFTATGATPVACFDELRRHIAAIDGLKLEVAMPADPASPDDLRALGWCVAVHNDYRLHGRPHTFWLMTKGGRALKGEGPSDAIALQQIRDTIAGIREPDLSTADLWIATVHFLMDCNSADECTAALTEQLDPLTMRYAADPNATAILEWRIAPDGEPQPHNGDGFLNDEPFVRPDA